MSNVWPSAGARTTSLAPMLPAAPARFSTTTGWPSGACSRSAIRRAKMSVEPPGAKGTTRRTGLFGYCACAGTTASATRSRMSLMGLLLFWADAGGGDDLAPALEVGPDHAAEFLRAERRWRLPGLRDAFAHVRHAQHLQQVGAQLAHDGRRRRRRRRDAVPLDHARQLGDAELLRGRHIGQRRVALEVHHGERAQL